MNKFGHVYGEVNRIFKHRRRKDAQNQHVQVCQHSEVQQKAPACGEEKPNKGRRGRTPAVNIQSAR